MTLPCIRCRQPKQQLAPRGICRQCDPVHFAAWQDELAEWDEQFRVFKAQTGMNPLDDWPVFEAWSDGMRTVTAADVRL